MLLLADESEITPDALNSLFEAADAGLPSVSGVQATPIDGGYGYLSKLFRLNMTWTGSGAESAPPTLVAKLPLAERLDDVIPGSRRMYRREAMFHRVVAPEAPIRTAKAWVAEVDEATGLATFVFEDLGGLETFEDDETVSLERVERALVRLAGLHAKYWESDELKAMDWTAHPAVTGVDQVPSVRFAAFWPRMVESGAYELSSTQLRLGELLCEKMDAVYEELHAGPKTLIHADLHQENLFFDGVEPVFIDWAATERASAAKDVAKLTASCLEPGTVNRDQPRLIRTYFRELEAHAATLRQARDGSPADGGVIPTEAEGSDRPTTVNQEILNQVQNDKNGRESVRPFSVDELERYVHLATCHYLAMMSFLSDHRDFEALAANMETRTDFTTSRVIAACDSEAILAVVEGI